MDPTQVITTVTALLDAIKKAREVSKRIENAEVQAILLDAQEAALALKEEVIALRTENLQLQEQLSNKQALVFDRGAYWRNGEPRDGPFCSRCFDSDSKVIRLVPTYGYWHKCPQCDKKFEVLSAPRGPEPPSIIFQVVRG